MISFVLPTRDRPDELALTLRALGSLREGELGDEAEVIVVDNASRTMTTAPSRLDNGVCARVLRLDENQGSAARNEGVRAARGDWVIMLDDDSAPKPGPSPIADVLRALPADVAAVGGEIRLISGGRERGGLPEVYVGCGAAIRRSVFLDLGGYDPAFDYYAEEYDLCARLINAGFRVMHTSALRFVHRKVALGRNMNRILHRLVRNNGWVAARYAPPEVRLRTISDLIDRYGRIAHKERALAGFYAGLAELQGTLGQQPDRALGPEHWSRFTGAAAARYSLSSALRARGCASVRLIEPGKGADEIERVLLGLGIDIDGGAADTGVIATLSPGPLLDAIERWPEAVAPWLPENRPVAGRSHAA